MLTHSARRAIAAFASLALVLGLVAATSSPSVADAETSSGHDAVLTYVLPAAVAGRVLDPAGDPVPYVSITFYRSVDGIGAPWVSVNQTSGTSGPESKGRFSRMLEPGRYTFKLNPQPRHGGRFLNEYYGDAATIETAAIFDQAGIDLTLPDIRLNYSGGLVTGRVTDVFNKPVANANVSSELSSSSQGYSLDETTTKANGTYTIRAGAAPVDLVFSKPTAHFRNVTRKVTVPADTTRTGEDVLMKPGSLSGSTPRISGTPKAGRSLKTTGGNWRPREVTKKYQWYRLKGSKTSAIRGATRSSHKPGKSDYGKRFRVTVTASYPTLPNKAVSSSWTRPLLHKSSLSLAGSSPAKRKLKLSAKVKVAGGRKASGKVRFNCQTDSGLYVRKRVSVKKGRASVTFKNLPPWRFTCSADYPGTSKIARSGKTRTVKVK